MKTEIKVIASAIHIINQHAKNAPSLYSIKQRAIQQLLKEGRAHKLGLHYSPNPGKAWRQLDVLIRVDDFLFHLPSTKEDRKTLEVIESNPNHRNPKVSMSLNGAKQILKIFYPQPKPPVVHKHPTPKQYTPYIGLSTYLNGKKR
ncbi:YkyB family protein [Fictibacillus terranigra]|uniref:YkyB family protein n=1 Tax=Fictibacillus terranigra TaxID=3058424 RepID=A0ABT8E1I2_9BACL|nr:YkyB family protein [Fictibacillus sp. CENA-BCM004]MDN4071768.1 YkyB family protein [Fictibacillus sp. CENA-BCM004]